MQPVFLCHENDILIDIFVYDILLWNILYVKNMNKYDSSGGLKREDEIWIF